VLATVLDQGRPGPSGQWEAGKFKRSIAPSLKWKSQGDFLKL
jgi:hypothetical protein